jgi:hypothetical protein
VAGIQYQPVTEHPIHELEDAEVVPESTERTRG